MVLTAMAEMHSALPLSTGFWPFQLFISKHWPHLIISKLSTEYQFGPTFYQPRQLLSCSEVSWNLSVETSFPFYESGYLQPLDYCAFVDQCVSLLLLSGVLRILALDQCATIQPHLWFNLDPLHIASISLWPGSQNWFQQTYAAWTEIP